jgi:deoxyribonuclease-4
MASGEAAGLERIARALRGLRRERPARTVMILLETTAGAGTVLGGRFEHLAHLIKSCDPPAGPGWHGHAPLRGHVADYIATCATDGAQPHTGAWLGVCADTCHLWAAGYDLRTAEAIGDTLGRLDDAVGLERVKVIHVNDARGGLGSHLDRHEHIGRGRLGREAFRLLMHHPALAALPFILETPKEDARGRPMDPVNLRALRRLADL